MVLGWKTLVIIAAVTAAIEDDAFQWHKDAWACSSTTPGRGDGCLGETGALVQTEVPEPLHKITRSARGGTVDCPTGKTCELECKGYLACQYLKGGTGHFAKITCDSGSARNACDKAKLPDCPTGKTCELECKGAGACSDLKKSTGHYRKITCEGHSVSRPNEFACERAQLPDCPEGKTCELECKGGSCKDLKGGTGHFPKITCGISACQVAKLPDCPEDKTCELECKGDFACYGLKKITGHFPKIACDGKSACGMAAVPDCPEDKTCELECKGWSACSATRHSTDNGMLSYIPVPSSLEAVTGHFAKITCIGNYACSDAKLPDCPEDKTCELMCTGHETCKGAVAPTPGAAGSTVDISGNDQVEGKLLSQPADLSRKMIAFRALGVRDYSWPPAQCKAHFAISQNTVVVRNCEIERNARRWPTAQCKALAEALEKAKSLWFCPSARKCAQSDSECGGPVRVRWGSTLGTNETHHMPTEPQRHDIEVTVEPGVSRVKVPVITDAGAGHQRLSCMQLGGVRTVGGTTVVADAGREGHAEVVAIFTLPERARPNYCIRSWAPLISKDQSVPVLLDVCATGRAELLLPPGVTTSGATLSLSSIKFVPFEVSGGIEFPLETSTLFHWKNAMGTHSYYHNLKMGNGRMCVLSGTVNTIWGAADSQTIGKLNSECTKDYTEGFRIIASVKVDDNQVWIHKGAAAPFQLFLRGTNNSELAVWANHSELEGKSVTVNLDGITLASGPGPKQCLSSRVLGESSGLRHNIGRKSKTEVTKLKEELSSKLSQVNDTLLQVDDKLSQTSAKSASEIKELKDELSRVHNKAAQCAYETKELKDELSRVHNKSVAQSASETKELKDELSRVSNELSQVNDKLSQANLERSTSPARSDFDGCNMIRNQVNTTQPGFAPQSVLKPTNMVVMGADVATRTCVLRGVVKFTSMDSKAVAFLDPNYRDPTTRMPFCFPMAPMAFLASVIDPNDSQRIDRSIALQIEPHGRIVVIGEEPKDVSVRLDNIMYHPLMEFQASPPACAPYCFPTGKKGNKDMPMAGCIKYCTPTQLGSDCECTMLKRLDCYKHVNVAGGVVCGQFKKLMHQNSEECDQICAGQLVAF